MLHLLHLNRASIRELGFGNSRKFRPIAHSNLAQPKILSRALRYLFNESVTSVVELKGVDIM